MKTSYIIYTNNSENKIEGYINKFKELGENAKKEDLEILIIQRDGEELFYISSKENTAETRIRDSKITRLNSVPVK